MPFERLENYIKSKVEITEQELGVIRQAFIPKKLRKYQYLLQEGDISKYVAFVEKGALRQYIIDSKGNEIITQFAIEDWWVADRESMANQTPSKYNIDAVENSELLLLSKSNGQNLEEEIQPFHRLMESLREQSAFAGQKRVIRELSYTAEEKYDEFLIAYPNIIQRFPQHMIASYLGFTPETLSRLRKKASDRN